MIKIEPWTHREWPVWKGFTSSMTHTPLFNSHDIPSRTMGVSSKQWSNLDQMLCHVLCFIFCLTDLLSEVVHQVQPSLWERIFGGNWTRHLHAGCHYVHPITDVRTLNGSQSTNIKPENYPLGLHHFLIDQPAPEIRDVIFFTSANS